MSRPMRSRKDQFLGQGMGKDSQMNIHDLCFNRIFLSYLQDVSEKLPWPAWGETVFPVLTIGMELYLYGFPHDPVLASGLYCQVTGVMQIAYAVLCTGPEKGLSTSFSIGLGQDPSPICGCDRPIISLGQCLHCSYYHTHPSCTHLYTEDGGRMFLQNFRTTYMTTWCHNSEVVS